MLFLVALCRVCGAVVLPWRIVLCQSVVLLHDAVQCRVIMLCCFMCRVVMFYCVLVWCNVV